MRPALSKVRPRRFASANSSARKGQTREANLLHRELSAARRALEAAQEQIAAEVQRQRRIEKALDAEAAAQFERLRERLHDGLGQLLTTISFLSSSLREKLAARGLAEAGELDEIIALLAKAISESRALAVKCESPDRAAMHSLVLSPPNP